MRSAVCIFLHLGFEARAVRHTLLQNHSEKHIPADLFKLVVDDMLVMYVCRGGYYPPENKHNKNGRQIAAPTMQLPRFI